MDGLVVWHTFFFGTFRTIFFAVGGSPEFVYPVIRSMMQWYIRIIHTYAYVYVTCLYLYMVASPRSTYLSFLNGILEYKMHIFFTVFTCMYVHLIYTYPGSRNQTMTGFLFGWSMYMIPYYQGEKFGLWTFWDYVYIYTSDIPSPGKLTWLAIENHLISNRRYIFIHGYFSIVIH